MTDDDTTTSQLDAALKDLHAVVFDKDSDTIIEFLLTRLDDRLMPNLEEGKEIHRT